MTMRRAARIGAAPRDAVRRLAGPIIGITLLLGGCAVAPANAPPPGNVGTATIAFGRFEFAGQRLDAEWHLPAAVPAGLVLVQHGFARRCANLRTTARRLADQGAMTLCIDAEMAGGNPALASWIICSILGRLSIVETSAQDLPGQEANGPG